VEGKGKGVFFYSPHQSTQCYLVNGAVANVGVGKDVEGEAVTAALVGDMASVYLVAQKALLHVLFFLVVSPLY